MADRPSWRDLDKQRDKSSHRKEEKAPRGRGVPRVDSATATYRRQLDAFFDKGVVPGHIKDKLAAGEGGGPSERTRLLRTIRGIESGPALLKAIEDLREKFGLPDEMEVLLRVLEHPSDEVLRETLDLIEAHADSGQQMPKKANFVQRLRGLAFSSFDPVVQRRAVALADKLA